MGGDVLAVAMARVAPAAPADAIGDRSRKSLESIAEGVDRRHVADQHAYDGHRIVARPPALDEPTTEADRALERRPLRMPAVVHDDHACERRSRIVGSSAVDSGGGRRTRNLLVERQLIVCQSSQQPPQQLPRADADASEHRGMRPPATARRGRATWPPSTDARRPLIVRRASTGGGRTSPHAATTASPRRRSRPRLDGSAPAVLAKLRPRARRVTGRGSSEIAVSSTVSSVPGRTASMASWIRRPCRPGPVRRGTRTPRRGTARRGAPC